MATSSNRRHIRKRRRTILLLIIALILTGTGILHWYNGSRNEKLFHTIQIQQTNCEVNRSEESSSVPPDSSKQVSQADKPTEKAVHLVDSVPDTAYLSVTAVLQNPELPTGCEITALTTVLNYHGFSVTKTELANSYVTYALVGEATFDEAFIGSPYDATSYGCFEPVMQEAAERYLSRQAQQNEQYIVKDLTGSDPDKLYQQVASGYPVMVWVSMYLMETEERFCWTTADGRDAIWEKNEHCMVLTGYDKTAGTVTVCDPLEGVKVYDADLFFRRYEELHRQAMVIY